MTNKTLSLFVAAALIALLSIVVYNNKLSHKTDKEVPKEDSYEHIWDDSWDNMKPEEKPIEPDNKVEIPIKESNKKGLIAKDYEDAIEMSKKEGIPVLLIFHGKHCPYCQTMEQSVYPDARVKEMMDNYIVCKIDTASRKNSKIASKFGVEYIPAFAITNGDEKILKFDQKSMDADGFVEWLKTSFIEDKTEKKEDHKSEPPSLNVKPPMKKVRPQDGYSNPTLRKGPTGPMRKHLVDEYDDRW